MSLSSVYRIEIFPWHLATALVCNMLYSLIVFAQTTWIVLVFLTVTETSLSTNTHTHTPLFLKEEGSSD